MANESKDTEKLRKIVNLLPGENCGKCGFDNCGAFAVALLEKKASPLDCRKSHSSLKDICEVLGIEVTEGAELQVAGRRGHHHGHHGHHGRSKGGRGHHHPGKHHAVRHGR